MKKNETIGKIGEIDTITRMLNYMDRYPNQYNKPFGADAEILELSKGIVLALTIDTLGKEDFVAGFDSYNAGWHVVNANFSDLAAVGAQPAGILISLVVPRDFPADNIVKISQGANDAVREFGAYIMGGDLNYGAELQLTGCAFGLVEQGGAITRIGVKPGDYVYMTGHVGGFNGAAICTIKNLDFSPFRGIRIRARVEAGKLIKKYASACTDTSDGVLSAINNLMMVNKVGFCLEDRPEIYLPQALQLCQKLRYPSELLLVGEAGEYELLFTVSEEKRRQLLDACFSQGIVLTYLGRATDSSICTLIKNNNDYILDPKYFKRLYQESASPEEYLEKLLTFGFRV
ncbi:thiamine-monophosphate kinase [Carboxydocella sp. ULO1]|uniref:thiamine-phosphate kinase n=1 Tax=Carboxydocella sp. ULO1 TaxID=1926599 RepID=UPI0009AE465B|nr:thiamine-phosphate kinase [Carboxydocella sp. ULO1]GAW28623.1 hypothetical protein ULO1_11930 [Carboxydocella sp. ULO1]